jgi:hypothetical protein
MCVGSRAYSYSYVSKVCVCVYEASLTVYAMTSSHFMFFFCYIIVQANIWRSGS